MRSRLTALALGVLLALALGELLGRALGPGPRPPGPPSVNWAAWVRDPRLGFRNRPELDFANHAIRGRPRVRTDPYGLRRGGPEGPPRLLVVGDSTSFGAEVEDDHTLPARLGTALGWPVANAAVRGFSTLQASRMLAAELPRHPEVEAVLYVLTTNDVEENLSPPFPAPRVVADAHGFQVREARLAGPAGTPVGDGAQAGWRWWWRTRSAVVDLAIDAARVLRPPRRLGGGRGAVTSLASEASPASGPEDLREDALAWILARMVATCRGRDLPLLVTVFPGTPPEVQAALLPRAGSFRGLVEEAGGVFLAVPPDFPYLDASLRARRPWIGYDPHFGAEGTRRWSEALLPRLRRVLRERTGAGTRGPAGSG